MATKTEELKGKLRDILAKDIKGLAIRSINQPENTYCLSEGDREDRLRQILKACKEAGLKFVPEKRRVLLGDGMVTLENPILLGSQIEEIDEAD